jgi:hypothetical protein
VQFRYFLNSEAAEAVKLTNKEITWDIINKIKELNLPIDPKDILFEDQIRTDSITRPHVLLERGEDYIYISAEYQITVHLLRSSQVVLNFSPSAYFELTPKQEKDF